MNNYSINMIKALNLKLYKYSNTMNINKKISIFENHLSIEKVKQYFTDVSKTNFEFTEIFQVKVEKYFLDLNVNKTSISGSIQA